MKQLFDKVSRKCSKLTTNAYSTSFSLGIRFLHKKFHDPIYAIYGFVRFADEIVDTFHDFDKEDLLNRFKEDTYRAIDEKISLNPILNSFQEAVHAYKIDRHLIDTFLKSMEMDLYKTDYMSEEELKQYVLGSAEVVGLMCLKVFCEGNQKRYKELEYYAMQLGSAFQKINFLRDISQDYEALGRTYFPGVDISQLDEQSKQLLEKEIADEFKQGYEGIKMLPKGARFGVYVAYVYYHSLFRKIQNIPSEGILEERVRIPNQKKFALLLGCYVRHSMNRI